jgi:hypothetical protein
MKPNSPLAVIACFVLLVLAVIYALPARQAVAAPNDPIEQYLVLNVAIGQTDAQVAAQLNNLAGQGWRLRCSTPNGFVMFR